MPNIPRHKKIEGNRDIEICKQLRMLVSTFSDSFTFHPTCSNMLFCGFKTRNVFHQFQSICSIYRTKMDSTGINGGTPLPRGVFKRPILKGSIPNANPKS